ncbi:MAG: Gfo/Idh/MocA family oxidoreductase [Alphaproteobacteria bacterium]|nr:Gfo/Idh/MocA family oxidoreductase [Alphaproteobacteria bacterium]
MTAPRRRLKVAAVGAGYFSQFQCQGWHDIESVELVALANRNTAKAAALAARFDVPKVYGDVATMLAAEQPDLLDIVTTPDTHRAMIGAAVARGVAVICQKPFGRNYAEALELTELAEHAGVKLIVHENFRWQPWYREAKRLIEAGRLGRLHSVAFRLRPGDGQGPGAYLDRQPYFQHLPRLLVYETGIHWIDTFRFLIGEVTAVFARLRRLNPSIVGEDAGYVVFEFASGATGLFDGNRLNDHVAQNPRRTMGEMWLEGAAGVLRLDGDARLWWKPHQGDEAEHGYDRGPADGFGGGACERLQRHVAAHLLEGGAVENMARDYLINVKIQEAIYRAHQDGRRVEIAGFDPQTSPIARTFEPLPSVPSPAREKKS